VIAIFLFVIRLNPPRTFRNIYPEISKEILKKPFNKGRKVRGE